MKPSLFPQPLFISVLVVLFFCSCQLPEVLSNKVIIAMSEPGHTILPISHHKGQENAECRRGIPEEHFLPWDKTSRQEASAAQGQQGDSREESITINAEDYWFKVIPSIHNKTAYYLVITDITFFARVGSGSPGEKSFTSGYCETSPLYILAPGDQIDYSHASLPFSEGNLIFYIDGLPSGVEEDGDNEDDATKIFAIPRYSVRWKIIGYFADKIGTRQGSFQKRGRFLTYAERF